MTSRDRPWPTMSGVRLPCPRISSSYPPSVSATITLSGLPSMKSRNRFGRRRHRTGSPRPRDPCGGGSSTPNCRARCRCGSLFPSTYQENVHADIALQLRARLGGQHRKRPVAPAESRGQADAEARRHLPQGQVFGEQLHHREPVLLLADPVGRRARVGTEGAPAGPAQVALHPPAGGHAKAAVQGHLPSATPRTAPPRLDDRPDGLCLSGAGISVPCRAVTAVRSLHGLHLRPRIGLLRRKVGEGRSMTGLRRAHGRREHSGSTSHDWFLLPIMRERWFAVQCGKVTLRGDLLPLTAPPRAPKQLKYCPGADGNPNSQHEQNG